MRLVATGETSHRESTARRSSGRKAVDQRHDAIQRGDETSEAGLDGSEPCLHGAIIRHVADDSAIAERDKDEDRTTRLLEQASLLAAIALSLVQAYFVMHECEPDAIDRVITRWRQKIAAAWWRSPAGQAEAFRRTWPHLWWEAHLIVEQAS